MSAKDKTAYCGIYCPDCIHFQNEYSSIAEKLENHLKKMNLINMQKLTVRSEKGLRTGNSLQKCLTLLRIQNAILHAVPAEDVQGSLVK